MVYNEGVAPLYRDAYFAIDTVFSSTTLRGLLPKEQREIVIPAALMNGDALHVVSPYILPSQEIEFRAGAVQEWLPIVAQDTDQAGRKEIQHAQVVILYQGDTYLLSGARR